MALLSGKLDSLNGRKQMIFFIKKNIFNSVQNVLLAVIAICLCLVVLKLYIPKAHADDVLHGQVVKRILYCIDGSTISGNILRTKCDGRY